jgi:chromosome segregation ATPase
MHQSTSFMSPRVTPHISGTGQAKDAKVFIKKLQQKLSNLECKYSNFVGRCANLFKNNPIQEHEETERYNKYNSTVVISYDPLDPYDPENHSNFWEVFKNPEEGFFSKNLVKNISSLVAIYQEKIFKHVQATETAENSVRDVFNNMLSDIIEIITCNEENFKEIVKTCSENYRDRDSLYDKKAGLGEGSKDILKLKENVSYYRSKYKAAMHRIQDLNKIVAEQHETLKSIRRNYENLESKVLSVPNRGSSVSKLSYNNRETIRFGNFFMEARSLNGSPRVGISETEILKIKNLKLKSKISDLKLENQNLRYKCSQTTEYETRINNYELEKQEIQDQLKNLQEKLTNFEKIAKNLINTNIQTEISLIDRKEIGKKGDKSKNIELDSPELSLMNSRGSIVESDTLQKNLEELIKEKASLESMLQSRDEIIFDLKQKILDQDNLDHLKASYEEYLQSLSLKYQEDLRLSQEEYELANSGLEKSNKNIELLESQLYNHKKTIETLESLSKNALKVEEEKNETIKTLKEELQTLYIELKELQTINKTKKIELNSMETTINGLKAQEKSLINSNHNLNANIASLTQSNKDLISEKANYIKEISNLGCCIEDLNEKITSLEIQIKNKDKYQQETNTQLKKHQDLENSYKTDIKYFKDLCKTLETKEKLMKDDSLRDQARISELLEDFNLKSDLINTLTQELKGLRQSEKDLIQYKQAMADLASSKESLIKSYEAGQLKNQELEKKYEELLKHSETFNQTIDSKDAYCEGLITEIETLKKSSLKQIESYEDRLQSLLRDKDDLISKDQAQTSELKRLQNHIDGLVEAYTGLQNSLDQKNQEFETAKTEINALKCTHQSLLLEHRENIEKNNEYLEINENLMRKVKETCEKLESFEEDKKQLLKHISSLNSQIKSESQSSQAQLTMLKSYQRTQATVKHTINAFVRAFKAEIQDIKQQINSQWDEMIDISQKLSFAKISIAKKLQKDSESLQELYNLIKISEKNEISLSNQLEHTEKTLEKLVLENSQLKGEIVALETENSYMKDLKNKEKTFRDALIDHENTISTQNSKINQLSNEIELISNQYNSNLIQKNAKIVELTEDKEVLENLDKVTQQKLNLTGKKLLQMTEINTNLQRKLEETEKVVKELSEKYERLQIEYKKIDIERKELLETKTNLIKTTKNLENNLISQEKQLQVLEKTLTTKETQIRELEALQLSKESEIELIIPSKKNDYISLAPQKKDSESNYSEKIKETIPVQSEYLMPESRRYKNAPQGHSYEINSVKSSKRAVSQSGSKEEQVSSKQAQESLNITPHKVLKSIKAADKRWVLLQTNNGSLNWKEETDMQWSGPWEFSDEDADEIKVCLGEWYTGSILQAIEKLKNAATKDLSLSFKQEENTSKKNSFVPASDTENIFKGLEISRIDFDDSRTENIEKIKSDVLVKDAKIEKKKRKLELHKEQISVLKEQLRINSEEIHKYLATIKDLETRIQSLAAINLPYLKQVYSNLILNLKVDKTTEDLVILMFKILDFTNEEIGKIQHQRKGSKKLLTKK